MNVIHDTEFQKILLSFICRDRNFLRDTGYLLSAHDFRPLRKGDGEELHVISKLAFDHWKKTREPIGPLLRTFVIDYADQEKLGDKPTEKLLKVVKEINNGQRDIISVDSVADKVIQFKKTRLKQKAVEEAADLLEKGKLTDEEWYRIARDAVAQFSKQKYESADYLKDYEARIQRREVESRIEKYPYLFIDPLDEDERFRTIHRGQFAIWLGYLKSGKSQALLQTAIAYIFQTLNVLYFTLEDSLSITENRLDGSLTGICLQDLNEKSHKFRKRFKKLRHLVHSKLRIIDGTENGLSVADIEACWEEYRNRGFIADAVIIDYDDEIVPPRKYGKESSARRLEFADIYRELRRFAARRKLFVWTAAQTGRKTEGKKIISSSNIAEDISKVRKVALALGVGCGDYGEDSKFVYVTASKNCRQHIGWNIMSNFNQGSFYDRDRTLRLMEKERKRKKREKD